MFGIADARERAAAFARLRKRAAKDDLLIVILIGHGTDADGDEAKFNLVGPDLSASEWADLLKPLPGPPGRSSTRPGRSFPFLRHLAGQGTCVS